MEKIPVILDTDIGSDIDDTWALCLMLLLSDYYDSKLVSVCFGDTGYRASLACKILERAGRSDIPVAKGLPVKTFERSQLRWLEAYDHTRYKGKVYSAAPEAIADTVMKNPGITTVICIAPATNIAQAVKLCPAMVPKVRIIGMYGSVYKGYFGRDEISAECNVVLDTDGFRHLLESGADVTLIPLDACGDFVIHGEAYAKIKGSENEIARVAMENYAIWQEDYDGGALKYDSGISTSILYDLPPILYPIMPHCFTTEEITLKVTEDGYTRKDPFGSRVKVATGCPGKQALIDFVTGVFTSRQIPQ